MCSEKDSKNCHRYLISQRLFEDFGVNATHIGYDGDTTKHVEMPEAIAVDETTSGNTLSLLLGAREDGKLNSILQAAASRSVTQEHAAAAVNANQRLVSDYDK